MDFGVVYTFTVMNNAPVNIHVLVLYQHIFSILLGVCIPLGMELLDCMLALYLTF